MPPPVPARSCWPPATVIASSDRQRSQTAPYRQVLRAKIVLLAARGVPNQKIAARLGVTADTARKWRGRLAAHGLAGLTDRGRAGRLASRLCRSPRSRRWPVSCPPKLACRCRCGAARNWPARPSPEAVTQAVSASTVGRWLAEDALKPWQHRSWIFIRDPDFGAKASRVLDLYARRFQGRPLVAIHRG